MMSTFAALQTRSKEVVLEAEVADQPDPPVTPKTPTQRRPPPTPKTPCYLVTYS